MQSRDELYKVLHYHEHEGNIDNLLKKRKNKQS